MLLALAARAMFIRRKQSELSPVQQGFVEHYLSSAFENIQMASLGYQLYSERMQVRVMRLCARQCYRLRAVQASCVPLKS